MSRIARWNGTRFVRLSFNAIFSTDVAPLTDGVGRQARSVFLISARRTNANAVLALRSAETLHLIDTTSADGNAVETNAANENLTSDAS